MLPLLSSADLRNGVALDAVSVPEDRVAFSAGAYLKHLFAGELGLSVAFTDAGSTSTLFGHIRKIVPLRSEEQMGRIDARRVVAAMENEQAIGDESVSESPTNAMGDKWATFVGVSDLPVIGHVSACDPRPAFVWTALVNLRPKAFRHGLSHGLNNTTGVAWR